MFQFGNVLFRPMEKQDLELLHMWENDAELMMYSRSRPLNFLSMVQLEKRFEERLKEEKHLRFIIELVDHYRKPRIYRKVKSYCIWITNN